MQSRKQAVEILHNLCAWLNDQRYLDSNPWRGVNLRMVEGSELAAPPTSRALSVEAYKVLLDTLASDISPAAPRHRFVLVFLRHTGLRASELVNARMGDLTFERDIGWRLYVVGKGRKARLVTLTKPAMAAISQYLQQRGIDADPLHSGGLATVSDDWRALPLLASVSDPHKAVSYPSLHASFTALVRRAMRHATLSPSERQRCEKATTHWMRHTFATRYAEAGGELTVLQAELGQVDPKTTAGYYRAIDQHRRREMDRIAQMGT
jgi:integrase